MTKILPGSLIDMVVKANITDHFDSTLRGRRYDRKILEDGTRQLFGVSPGFPEASINSKCTFAGQAIKRSQFKHLYQKIDLKIL